LKGKERCRGTSSAKAASIGRKLATLKRLEIMPIEGQAGAEDTHQQPPASFIMKTDFLSLLSTTGAVNTRNGHLMVLDTLAATRSAIHTLKRRHGQSGGGNGYRGLTSKTKAR